jgi:two-component system sensor histidine kinase BaeS
MRSPGLLGRSIVASVLVATVAIVATALLTLNVTQDSLERQRAHRENVDQGVVTRLLAFGRAHPDWIGVDTLLRRLAGQGQQLVVTDLHGQRLAATRGGGTTPADPSAVLNPLGTVIDAATRSVPHSYRDLGLPKVFLDDRSAGDQLLTAAQRYPAIAVCARQSGDVSTSSVGLGSPIVFVTACSDTAFVDTAVGSGTARSLARLNNTVVFDEGTCLGRRGVQSLVARLAAERPRPDAPTLASVSVPVDAATVTARQAVATRRVWHDCATSTLTRHLSPVVAPEALLYIVGSQPARDGIVDRIGRIRITGALLAILVAAVVASLLASRQVLHPVRRLTAATQQMATGQLSTRVEIQGRDEVATLARSFNDMAQALADAEEQRRRMVDDIAHELRTPLTNIRGYLEAGQDGVLPRDDGWNASLLEEATLLQHVVDDLQTLAQADAGRLTVHVDTDDLAGTVDLAIQAMTGYAASRGVRIERTGSAATAPHDRMRLRQVVGNLLANAIRYAPPASVVTVDVEGGDPAALTVRDRGPGIAPEHLPHVFERFYRADPSRTRDTGGSGLGLAIVEQLVHAHGGTVTAFNAPDGGAVFRVGLSAPPSAS